MSKTTISRPSYPTCNARPVHTDVPIRDKVHRSERALFDHLIGESTRVLAPPLAHGTDDRAEVATFCGEDVLGPRGTHRIEASLDDAILLKRPQTLR